MRALPVLLAAAVAVAGCAAPEAPEPGRLPRIMAALGDSITRAANPSGAAPGEHPEASWATGNASLLRDASHAERLRLLGGLGGGALNLAASGARVSDLPRQARLAVEARAEYVTILVGANDACRRSAADMTGEEAFRASFREAARVLADGLPPGATVYVASVPDLNALREVHADDDRARSAWRAFRPCPVLLGEASTEADREAVRARVAAYNRALAEEAEAFGFVHDGGALHRERLQVGDVSDLDYFHPSFSGQARLAARTWAAGPFAEAEA